MGVVWKAVDTNLEREVAIKVLPVAIADRADRLQRFELEAKTTGSLNHPTSSWSTTWGVTRGRARLTVIDTQTGQTTVSEPLTDGPTSGWVLSPDRRWLYFARTRDEGDIWMLENTTD